MRSLLKSVPEDRVYSRKLSVLLAESGRGQSDQPLSPGRGGELFSAAESNESSDEEG